MTAFRSCMQTVTQMKELATLSTLTKLRRLALTASADDPRLDSLCLGPDVMVTRWYSEPETVPTPAAKLKTSNLPYTQGLQPCGVVGFNAAVRPAATAGGGADALMCACAGLCTLELPMQALPGTLHVKRGYDVLQD